MGGGCTGEAGVAIGFGLNRGIDWRLGRGELIWNAEDRVFGKVGGVERNFQLAMANSSRSSTERRDLSERNSSVCDRTNRVIYESARKD
jgi:hypothetical protein